MLASVRVIARKWVSSIQSAIRYTYFPAMFVGVNGAAVAVVVRSPAPAVVAVSLAALAGLALILSFGAERILPYDRAWNVSRGDRGRDLAHFVVNESMSFGPVLIVPLFAVAAPSARVTPWPVHWPVLLQIVFVVAVFDLVQNLFHWASHVWRPLWRLHAVHHSVERMYGFNGIMKHPMYQLISSVVSMTPLVLLGMPDAFSVLLAFCTFVQLLLQHSNVDYRTGPFRWICATAEVHRFHHLKGQAGDVNFALFFSGWDHLLGNAYDASRRLGTSDIGLDDRDYPQDYLGQLLAPFRTRPGAHLTGTPAKTASE